MNVFGFNIYDFKCMMFSHWVFMYVIEYNRDLACLFRFNPSREWTTGGDETNRRTRAEPQSIVGQAYSHTYSTLSQLSRLQTICLGDSSKFRFLDNYSALCFCNLSRLSESWRVTPISLHVSPTETLLSSMDSDLEAFSHNPTDGSFTALAGLPTVFTNYLNQLFLSY